MVTGRATPLRNAIAMKGTVQRLASVVKIYARVKGRINNTGVVSTGAARPTSTRFDATVRLDTVANSAVEE